MPDSGQLFDSPADLPEELTEILATGTGVRIERIVSRGHVSPEGFWYDQAEDEWVAVLRGRATLLLEGGERRDLGPGDWLWLPAGLRHRVESTDPEADTVWLAVFVGGPDGDDRGS